MGLYTPPTFLEDGVVFLLFVLLVQLDAMTFVLPFKNYNLEFVFASSPPLSMPYIMFSGERLCCTVLCRCS